MDLCQPLMRLPRFIWSSVTLITMTSTILNKAWLYSRMLFPSSVYILLLTTACGAQDLQPGQVFRDCPQCPEMVMLPSGTFQMGSSPSDFQRDLAFRPPDSFINRLATMLGSPGFRGFPEAETPQHVVTIKQAFAMSKYPVTVAEFAAFVKDTGYTARGDCLILGSGKPHISSGTSWQNDGFSQIGDDPVVCMRVDDTQAYIHWLNKRINRDRKSPNSGSIPIAERSRMGVRGTGRNNNHVVVGRPGGPW